MSTQADIAAAAKAASGSAGEAILVGQGLTKVFGGFAAVKDVDLSVRRGSIHALIGPNGAGKTTCFNLLTKTFKPTRGRIVFDGVEISSLRTSEVARRGLVRSFQISAIFPHLTVLENVRVALQCRFGMPYHFWRSLRAVAPLNGRAEQLLEQVGLAESRNLAASDLSYGKRRALEIATTLALEPKVLLLDEPTAGMGHEDIAPITALIRAAAVGRTVLLVEHNLSVVSDLCDRITVLQHGEVLAEGSYDEVARDPAVIAAYLGGADE